MQNICLEISSNRVLPDLSDVMTKLTWLGLQRFWHKHVDREGQSLIAGNTRSLAITNGNFYNKCTEVVETN